MTTMHTTAEVAAMFRLSEDTIRKYARENGIGMIAGRRGGYRFTDEDVAALRGVMKVAAPVAPRRRRRRAA